MKKWILFASTLCLVFIIAACGANNESKTAGTNADSGVTEPGTAANEVVIKASNWKFDQEVYTIKKGENLKLESTEGVHGIEISKAGVKLDTNKTTTITLDAGEYEIKCNVPCGAGHMKMVSKLVVQ